MYSNEEIINNAKSFYLKIGSIPCSALGNMNIVFGSVGWRHILWKNRLPRNTSDKLRRIKLLKYAPVVVNKGCLIFYRQDYKNGILGKFWKLKMKINNKEVKVVIRQIGGGDINFFSIM